MITSTEILAAIQTRLTGDVSLVALVPAASMGNFLPQDNSYPHIFWQISSEVMDIKGETAQEVTLQLDIWSKQTSSKEVLQIADAVQNALDGIPLTIASGDCFATYLLNFGAGLESDGKTYLGTAVYTIKYGDS